MKPVLTVISGGRNQAEIVTVERRALDELHMEIVARNYDLSYDTPVYDFNVHMEVQMTHFGSLLVPLGLAPQAGRPPVSELDEASARRRPVGPRLGDLPLARRDVEHLRHLLSLQRRLHDLNANPRAQRALTRRSIFPDALIWLEIHGGAPELVEHWNALRAEEVERPAAAEESDEGEAPRRRRRRRRRRRFRPATGQ